MKEGLPGVPVGVGEKELRDVGGGEGDEGAVCRVLGCEREEEENTEGEKRI